MTEMNTALARRALQYGPDGSPDGSKEQLTRFDRKREDLLNAAGALFNRHGLREATLAVIAADIGLNLKSLRYYFARREDLVAAAFLRSIDLHRVLVDAAMNAGPVENRIRHLVRGYFSLLISVRRGDTPEFVGFSDLRALTEPHSVQVWSAYNDLFRAIRRLLAPPEQPRDKGRLNAIAHMMLSQLNWSLVWSAGYMVEDLPRVAERFLDILLNGVAAARFDLPKRTGDVSEQAPAADRLSHGDFLKTATSLINKHGYRGASVERISTALNVTKGSFYHHNETRDGLVITCFERTFDALRTSQDAALAKGEDGLTTIGSIAVSLIEQQMREEGILLRLSALYAVGPDFREQISEKMSQITRRFGDMLNDGIIDGSIRPCNVGIAGEMLSAMINSAEELQRWVPAATTENAADLYVWPFMFGLSRP